MDGVPRSITTRVLPFDSCDDFEVKDSVQYQEISWIKPDGLDFLMAAHPLIREICWDELRILHYIEGKKIMIDGLPFLCRVPTMGQTEDDEDNEWAKCLKAAGTDDDSVWHWQNFYSYGQENNLNQDNLDASINQVASMRGYYNAQKFAQINTSSFSLFAGFRPLLEPLPFISAEGHLGKLVELEGQPFYCSNFKPKLSGFRPKLVPVKKAGDGSWMFDLAAFGELHDEVKHVRMYFILMDGVPLRQDMPRPPVYKHGTKLELTDKFFGEQYLILWRIESGTATALQEVLQKIAGAELEEQGYAK